MRPPPLPHHRTCGFPHPAVEPPVLRSGSSRKTMTSEWTLRGRCGCTASPSEPSVGWWPQLPRPTPSSFLSARSPDSSSSLSVLRPFAPRSFRTASTLLRSWLTSPALSRWRSPRVRTGTFCARRRTLPDASGGPWDFAVARQLVARTRPLCPFVFLRLRICLQLLSAWPSRDRPCRSVTVTAIGSVKFLSS